MRRDRHNNSVVGVADVLVDDSGRLGSLSYLVPSGFDVHIGDAVEVPFGTRVARGMVVGSGDASKATRELLAVYGPRADSRDIELARELAELNFSTFANVASRLAPKTKRGNPALDAGEVVLRDGPTLEELGWPEAAGEVSRTLLACAPGVDHTWLAAREAERLARLGGEVLILCPTKQQCAQVAKCFVSGAARLDVVPKKGDPSPWRGFAEGTVRVAVATRTAALWSSNNLVGIIVVDEEHPGHVEAVQPHTHARDVASARSLQRGINLSITTTNPSPAALGSKVKMFAVGRDVHWPEMHMITRPRGSWNSLELPGELKAALGDPKFAGTTPVVVAGSARAVRTCSSCRARRWCELCADHSCAHITKSVCERCGSNESRLSGWDCARVAKAIGARGRAVAPSELHDLKNAGLVVLFDADALARVPGLIEERYVAGVLLSAARAAGASGSVVVVSSHGDLSTFDDLVVRKDLVRYARRTWALAKEAKLPPFGRLVTMRVAGSSAPRLTNWPGVVYGPRRVDGEYEVLVRCEHNELAQVRACVDRLRRRYKVRVSVS